MKCTLIWKNYNLSFSDQCFIILSFPANRILNKLTPEKFDKLSLELLNVGIETEVILRGVILLVSKSEWNDKSCSVCVDLSVLRDFIINMRFWAKWFRIYYITQLWEGLVFIDF